MSHIRVRAPPGATLVDEVTAPPIPLAIVIGGFAPALKARGQS